MKNDKRKKRLIKKVLVQKAKGMLLLCIFSFSALISKSIFIIILAFFLFPILFFTKEELKWIQEWEKELKRQRRRCKRKEGIVIKHYIRKGEQLWQQKKKN